ncbi:MAG: YvcK family protein [Candidatus Bipolaricaulota bacterium]|nr:YvcK family protein [Candidatus Bipolaricaulota bacterium]MDW8111524.1 YvcK family protein [Candidatus Bipolaricaulota bacterium]MDW8329412.1 YvcK family protein [Candidatus Bipolaricaulota bacterium]
MSVRVKSAMRWLHPGIGIKRWLALVAAGLGVAILGLFVLLGKDLVREIYKVLAPSELSTYLLALGLLGVGVAAIVVGVHQIGRGIVRVIAAPAEGRVGQMLYEHYRLKRGPRIVAVGGGTGLSALLRGLKGLTHNITAVVTVMDDGGSSGRLRHELQMLPPGDIRNCLIALAEDESRISQLFNHRFERGNLAGHSLGNLVIAGLQEMTGSFDKAIEEMSLLLKTRGQVLPATLEHVELVAELDDGRVICGESRIVEARGRIRQIKLSRDPVTAYPKVLDEIAQAELIVLGPGSLYTSVIPNLLVTEIRRAIERSPAPKIYVVNLMTQPGETDGFGVREHLRALGEYIDLKSIDIALVNSEPVPAEIERLYAEAGASPVKDNLSEQNEWGIAIVRAPLLEIVPLWRQHAGSVGKTLKHDPKRLAQAIRRCAPEVFR